MITPNADEVAILVHGNDNSSFKEMPRLRCLDSISEMTVELMVIPRKNAVADTINMHA